MRKGEREREGEGVKYERKRLERHNMDTLLTQFRERDKRWVIILNKI